MDLSQILGIVGWIAAIFGGLWVIRLKNAAKEIKDVITVTNKALDEKSAGGKTITAEEWKDIAVETIEAVTAIVPLAQGVANKLKSLRHK